VVVDRWSADASRAGGTGHQLPTTEGLISITLALVAVIALVGLIRGKTPLSRKERINEPNLSPQVRANSTYNQKTKEMTNYDTKR
jgi:hypothetical protein